MQQREMHFNGNIVLQIWITQSFKERNRGLLALPGLEPEQGLLITPCRSIHTFAMGYSLDVLYLDRDFKIVKIVEHMPPNRMSMALLAHSTLEINAGEVQRLGLKVAMQGELSNFCQRA